MTPSTFSKFFPLLFRLRCPFSSGCPSPRTAFPTCKTKSPRGQTYPRRPHRVLVGFLIPKVVGLLFSYPGSIGLFLLTKQVAYLLLGLECTGDLELITN